MKRLISVLAAMAAILSFTSCEKQASKAIVGTWDATRIEMTIEGIKMEMDIAELGVGMEMTFNEDGTGTMVEKEQGESISMDFTYSVEGNTLTMEAEGDVVEIPVTIEKNNMTMVMNGEMLDEPGMNVTIHFVKK